MCVCVWTWTWTWTCVWFCMQSGDDDMALLGQAVEEEETSAELVMREREAAVLQSVEAYQQLLESGDADDVSSRLRKTHTHTHTHIHTLFAVAFLLFIRRPAPRCVQAQHRVAGALVKRASALLPCLEWHQNEVPSAQSLYLSNKLPAATWQSIDRHSKFVVAQADMLQKQADLFKAGFSKDVFQRAVDIRHYRNLQAKRDAVRCTVVVFWGLRRTLT